MDANAADQRLRIMYIIVKGRYEQKDVANAVVPCAADFARQPQIPSLREAQGQKDIAKKEDLPNDKMRGVSSPTRPLISTEPPHPSAVVGSITLLTSDTLFAGKPPCAACSRTIASLGAMYTQ